MRKMWAVINQELLCKQKQKNNDIKIIKEGGNKYETSEEIANVLNSYFLNYARITQKPNRRGKN